MSPPDPILTELTALLHWPVQRMPSGYRIRFTDSDYSRKRISGVEFIPEMSCPRLVLRDYDEVPLVFEYVLTDLNDPNVQTEIIYYTLAGRLHRENMPAKYVIRPIDGCTVEIEYRRHGVRHRDAGAASQIITGIQIERLKDEYGSEISGPFRMLARQIRLAWFCDGMSGIFPSVHHAILDDVEILFNEDNQYHDHGDTFAFIAASTEWHWHQRGVPSHDLVPMFLQIDDFAESYLDGKWQTRNGDFVRSKWSRGSQIMHLDGAFPPGFMIDQINLMSGPFHRTPEAEIRLEQALEAVPTDA